MHFCFDFASSHSDKISSRLKNSVFFVCLVFNSDETVRNYRTFDVVVNAILHSEMIIGPIRTRVSSFALKMLCLDVKLASIRLMMVDIDCQLGRI